MPKQNTRTEPPVEAEKVPTKTYEVISPLEHDQVLYKVGETIDLTDAQAAPLKPHTVREPTPQLVQLPAEDA